MTYQATASGVSVYTGKFFADDKVEVMYVANTDTATQGPMSIASWEGYQTKLHRKCMDPATSHGGTVGFDRLADNHIGHSMPNQDCAPYKAAVEAYGLPYRFYGRGAQPFFYVYWPNGWGSQLICSCSDGTCPSAGGYDMCDQGIKGSCASAPCENKCDTGGECGSPAGEKCSALIKEYSCADYYAPGKAYAGWCDKECGYGSCAKAASRPDFMGVDTSKRAASPASAPQVKPLTDETSGGGGGLTSCGDPSLGPVLNGVDIVATFKLAQAKSGTTAPVMGSSVYPYTNTDTGYSFYFATQANLDEYKASPESFPIGAGGYCGLAVSGGDPACGDSVCQGGACTTSSATFEVATDGKLYFFLGAGAMSIFNRDQSTSTAGCTANIAAVEKLTGKTCLNTDKFNCHGGGGSTTCENKCDTSGACGSPAGEKCSALIKEYSCVDYYAPGKAYAGWCDKECG